MSPSNACPQCGLRVPPDAPLGLCPRCLMNAAASSAETAAYNPAAKPTGPPPVDHDGFLLALRELDLVPAAELDPLAAATGEDAAHLARVLVQAKKLTAYQAGAVLQGKARGLLIGPYVVIDKLGVGGMGVVFKAQHRPSRRVVALKILPPSFGRDPDAVRRFRREFQVASRLSHPNLVAAIEASEDRGVHYLTMDYIPGYDLDRLVAHAGPMELRLALHCAIQVARGLEAAHAQGVVHRDIKPGNIMIDPAGQVRVLDLGLARVIEAAGFGQTTSGTLTQTGAYMGTVDFLAPEQANDARSADGRADIYSLGCTLYYLLTGKPPFPADTALKRLMAHQDRPAPSLRATRPEVPAALEQTYLAMMAKRPAERPQTMSDVVLALENCRVSAREAGDVSADLKTFARTALKRAPERKRRGPDASVFARPTNSGGLTFDPDLNLEDLVGDYRQEVGRAEIPEEKLPPIVHRPLPRRTRRRRSPAASYAMVAVAVCALAVAGYALRPAPPPAPKDTTAAPVPPPSALTRPIAASTASFVPLLRDLRGWEPRDSNRDDWTLSDDGELTARGHGSPRMQLLSPRSYTDFVVRFEFAIEKGTDGGLVLLGPEGGKDRFLEVRVGGPVPSRDIAGLWTGSGDVGTKSFRADPPPAIRRDLKWNAIEAEFRGGRLTVAVNGRPTSYPHSLNDLPGPRRIGFMAKAEKLAVRNVEILDLSGPTAPARPPRTLYVDDFDFDWKSTYGTSTQGVEKGVYYFNAAGRGQWWWDCPVYSLPAAFSIEATGRVVGGDGDRGSWGFQVPLSKDLAFQVWLNREGELWYEPNSSAAKDPATGMVPRVGPFVSPAVRKGSESNTLTMTMRPGGIEIRVNGTPAVGPLDIHWDAPVPKVMKFIGCYGGRVRAEFDRVEIRELPGPSAPSPATSAATTTASAGFVPLFNGKDLSGWTGPPGRWTVENGEIVGRTRGDLSQNDYLLADQPFGDFHLKARVKLLSGNSGIQFRSRRSRDGAASGPQADIADSYWGSLYEERGRGLLERYPEARARALVRKGDWNDFEIIAQGHHVQILLNGTRVVDRTDPNFADKGLIGLQLHTGPAMEARFRDLQIKRLDSSFVSLFNGKDLTGWTTHPSQPGRWSVENGLLVGRGPDRSYLYTDREYGDVHIRVEARINSGGNSGVLARGTFGPAWPANNPQFPTGYEAQIDSTTNGPDLNHTGSLYNLTMTPVGTVRDVLAPSNQWFTMDLTVQGNRVTVAVDGRPTVIYNDPGPGRPRGRIGLQSNRPETIVEFRRVEIRELGGAGEDVEGASAASGFVPLFNGRDLTGWDVPAAERDGWEVKDGLLIGSGPSATSHLYTKRGDYRDVHVRVEARINAPGNSGVVVRASGRPLWPPDRPVLPHGYQAHISSAPTDDNRTGYLLRNTSWGPPLGLRSAPRIPANEWFTLDLIARGRTITIQVDGRLTSEYVDNTRERFDTGHIALEKFGPDTGVAFRKIELRELTGPEDAAPDASSVFVPLFNGRDLRGWVFGMGDPARFRVEDEAIVADGTGNYRTMGALLTERPYTDFVVRFQFQAPKDADSGLIFLSEPGDTHVLDVSIRTFDERPSGMAVLNWHSSGRGSDALRPQAPAELRPPGAWNDMEVEVRARHLRASVNDREVLEADLSDLASRSRAHAMLGRTSGRIGLQAHTGPVRFRNIEIRDLSP